MQNKPSGYQDMYDQWGQMPPPDPRTLLKLIMTPGFLTQHQMDAIKQLLSQPNSAAPSGPAGVTPPAPPSATPMGAPPK